MLWPAEPIIKLVSPKFEILSDQVKGNIEMLMISEIKIDDSFTIKNYLIDGFSTLYRSDPDSKGGGIMLCLLGKISRPIYLQ